MKVQSVILLRRKYVSYLFELADQNFHNLDQLTSAVDQFEELISKDKELEASKKRLEGLQVDISNDSKYLDSMAHYNPKATKEASQLKQNVSKKINTNIKDYLSNYQEMNDLYQGIILHNASLMMAELEKNPLFKKMQLAIQKTDKEFLKFCQDFKQDEILQHTDINIKIKNIISHLKDLSESLADYKLENVELKLNPLNMSIKMKVKNLKIKIHTLSSNIDHLNQVYKSLYPETLKFRINEIKVLSDILSSNQDNTLGEVSTTDNTQSIISNINNIYLSPQTLTEIQNIVKKMIEYYSIADNNNIKTLNHINEEKEKISKAAISFDDLTIKAARQWLELHQDGWFKKTKTYIQNHPLAPTNITISLLD
jgi:hypothetical protein